MKPKIVGAFASVCAVAMFTAAPALASPEVPNPPANQNGIDNGAGIGCDMGKFHSELAKEGRIGKNKGHYPGQHAGASGCKGD